MDSLNIERFLNEDYGSASLYMSYRSIASVVDGLKPSQRKVVYTIKKLGLESETKVSNLSSVVSLNTQYLHGEASLQGAIEGMAQSFSGSNNIPLLSAEGNFGSRLLPEPSAPRYIFTKKSPELDKIFKKEDDSILDKQIFEGDTIEPRFFVPVLPMILVNGSRGMGVGYAQNILPRDPRVLVHEMMGILEGRGCGDNIIPWYRGFTGQVIPTEKDGVWEIRGCIVRKSTTNIDITELPIGYDLQKYLKILRDLKDKKIIGSFVDKSDPKTDRFLFSISVTREFSKKSNEEILRSLRLITRETENLTCFDEHNKIIVFKNVGELLRYYCKIRIQYYSLRIERQILDLKDKIEKMYNIRRFIREINDGSLILKDKNKKSLEEYLRVNKYLCIVGSEGSSGYGYLTSIPIYSLTMDRVSEIDKSIEIMNKEMNNLHLFKEKDIWKKEMAI